MAIAVLLVFIKEEIHMKLNEMEKKLLFQVKGDDQGKVLYELYMTVRYSNNSEDRKSTRLNSSHAT